MFNIVIVNNMNEFHEKYAEELESREYTLKFCETNSKIKSLNGVDAIIINDNLNVGQNCELIMELRGLTDKFIWLLSDKSARTDRIVYYKLGIDGIFDHNMDPEEFSLCVQALLNKFSNRERINSQNGNTAIQLNSNNLSVIIKGKHEIRLTRIEFMVMEFLITHKGKTITYEELSRKIWQDLRMDCRYRISNVVFHIRKKIEEDPNKPKYIITIRSRGYMLSE